MRFIALLRMFFAATTGVSPAISVANGGDIDIAFAESGAYSFFGTLDGQPDVRVREDHHVIYAASRHTSDDVIVDVLNADGGTDPAFNGGSFLVIPHQAGGKLFKPHLYVAGSGGDFWLGVADVVAGVGHPMVCHVLANGALDPGFTAAEYPGQSGCIRMNVPGAVAANGMNMAGLALDGATVRFAGTGVASATSYGLVVGEIKLPPANPAVTFKAVSAFSKIAVNGMAWDVASRRLYFAGAKFIVGPDDYQIYMASYDYLNLSMGKPTYKERLQNYGSFADEGRAVVVDGANRLYVASAIAVDGASKACLIFGLHPGDLTQDVSYGPDANGFVYAQYGSSPVSTDCNALALGTQGDLYVGGNYREVYDEVAIAHLDSSGMNDPRFGTDGAVHFFLGPAAYDSSAQALSMQNGQPIVFARSQKAGSINPADVDMYLLRLTDPDVIFRNGFE